MLGSLFVKINIFLFFVILKSVGSETLSLYELDERIFKVGKFEISKKNILPSYPAIKISKSLSIKMASLYPPS